MAKVHPLQEQKAKSINKKTKYKKKIPVSLKHAVWLKNNGKQFDAKCFVSWCANTIDVFSFEAGHDIPESKGGPTTLDNLKPICTTCNRSMGNMYTIKEFSDMFSGKTLEVPVPIVPIVLQTEQGELTELTDALDFFHPARIEKRWWKTFVCGAR
jgi:hypothetical protein